MKWNNEIENLKKLVFEENLSYEEIGRIYECSGNNIKKVLQRRGIELPVRSKNSGKEPVNKGTGKVNYCLNCGKEITPKHKYCDLNCQHEFEYKQYINNWKNGKESGLKGEYGVSSYIKRYLFNKYNSSCQCCGWNKRNEHTKNIPLEIHHIDGNYLNNSEENLQLLCPNCHSLTETYKNHNKDGRKGRKKYL